MVRIFYDGECPFCARYVAMLRLQETGAAQLIDLREAPDDKMALEAAGYDCDQGMVVEHDRRRYGGSDAVAFLAALTTPSGLFNRLNRLLLADPRSAGLVYPILRAGRWLALFLLDRRMIGDTGDTSAARREIFTTFFGLFSIFHFCNYAFEYQRLLPGWDMVCLLIAAFVALAKPASVRALFALMLISTVSTVVQAPIGSNHTMVRSAAMLGYWLAMIVAMLRNDATQKVFERFAPAGAGALLVMYFFGIFHKLNTDFLDPATSCATALWAAMPQPVAALDTPFVQYGTIYGTFVAEGLIAVALITRSLRHIGIAAGIAFHLLLSLSSYAMYISFTMLALALHSLFLNERAARAVLGSPTILLLRTKMAEPIYRVLFVAIWLGVVLLSFVGRYTEASLAAMILILPFCWAVLRHGGHPGAYGSGRASLAVAGITTALFFANCMMPYLGLKTGQTVNMFANLTLEGGKSNHLVFSGPTRPFGYLDHVGSITDAGGDPAVEYLRTRNLGVVEYALFDILRANRDLRLSFEMDGRTYTDVGYADLREEIDAQLYPGWFGKFFLFQPVYLGGRESCNV